MEITGDGALTLTAAFLLVGAPGLLLVVWAAAAGRLRRTGWIGLRSDLLLASDSAWRAGHAAALPLIAITCGAATLLALTGLLLPWTIARAAILFLAAAALFGGAVRAQVIADQAADD